MDDPKRGEIWLADLKRPIGSEPAGRRRVVVVQTDKLSGLNTRIVAVVTGNVGREKYRGSVELPQGISGLRRDSVVVCHSIAAVDISWFVERLGELPEHVMWEIETELAFCFEIPIE